MSQVQRHVPQPPTDDDELLELEETLLDELLLEEDELELLVEDDEELELDDELELLELLEEAHDTLATVTVPGHV